MNTRTGLLKLISISSIGSLLEFYDFAIYAFFAQEIGQSFFPSDSKMTSLIASFGVFAVGYLIRPIGGIIFSHLGDKFGRKKNFALSILIMAFSTLIMGLVPSYQTIGSAGSIIFFAMRILQGLSLGAETPGALTYIAESVKTRSGFWCSIVFTFMNLGAVLAIALHTILNHFFNSQAITDWAWRLPFILGGLLGFFGWQIRKNMSESFEFKRQQWKADFPLIDLFRYYPLKLIAAICIAIFAGTTVSLLYLYMPSYLENLLHYHYNIINLNGSIGLILYSIMIVFFGFISDKISRRFLITLSIVLLMLYAYPAYVFLAINNHSTLPTIFALFAVFAGMLMGNIPSLFTKLFVSQVRYTGVAMSYNIGVGLSAGLVPMLSTILIKYTNVTLGPVLLIYASGLIALIGILLIPRGFLNKH